MTDSVYKKGVEMLSQEQVDGLRRPFPDNAILEDRSRGFMLHSVKAAYIFERLNDVFGICGIGWRYTHSPIEITDNEVTTEVALQYRYNPTNEEVGTGPFYWENGIGWVPNRTENPDWSQPIFAHGGKRIGKGGSPLTDAKKSAVTDGLTKAASMLGVAHHIFKGLGKQGVVEGKDPHEAVEEPIEKPEPKAPESLEELQTMDFMLTPDECKEQGLDMGGYANYVLDLLKNVEYEGKQYYAHRKHRDNLYKQLFGETDLRQWVLGWFRLLEGYAFNLVQVDDNNFEEKKEHYKKVVKAGVENQVDWFGAIELLE